MRFAHSTIVLGWVGASVLGVAVAGCGDGADIPSGGVAKVGTVVVKRSDFDRVYPSTQVRVTDEEQAKVAAMQIVLQQEWTRQEAAAKRATVSGAKVKRALEQQKDAAFKTEKEYQNFLVSSKRSEPMLLEGMRQQLLMTELSRRATKSAAKVTPASIAAYYERNRKRFKLPARRNLRILMTKTEAQAEEAKRKLEGGGDWGEIALAYSKDPDIKTNRGTAKAVSTLGIEPLDEAVEAAETGTVSDPVETQYGWFVFEVEKVVPPSQQSLKKSTPVIRQQLVATRRQRAEQDYFQEFQQRYRERTECAEGFEVAECSNGPDRNPTIDQNQPPRRASPTTPQQ
jgi:foldase protein PrsA